MTISNRTASSIKLTSVLSLMAALLICSTSVFAEDPVCKSKGGELRVVYPELARRMKISGTVRLQVLLTASGSVRESRVLGGNPVLASAAQQAVKDTRFQGAEPCIAVFEFKQ